MVVAVIINGLTNEKRRDPGIKGVNRFLGQGRSRNRGGSQTSKYTAVCRGDGVDGGSAPAPVEELTRRTTVWTRVVSPGSLERFLIWVSQGRDGRGGYRGVTGVLFRHQGVRLRAYRTGTTFGWRGRHRQWVGTPWTSTSLETSVPNHLETGSREREKDLGVSVLG